MCDEMVEVLSLADKDSPSIEVKFRLLSATMVILKRHWPKITRQSLAKFTDFLIEIWENGSDEHRKAADNFIRDVFAGRHGKRFTTGC